MIEPADAAGIIQHILTPAVMISSSALFLLGLQNKFSNLFSRFRSLNQERRTCEAQPAMRPQEKERLENVKVQLDRLLKRTRYVKNAILFCYLAILSFLLTSVSLFLGLYLHEIMRTIAVIFFLSGLAEFIFAVVLMILETRLAYSIIQLERRA